MSTTKKRNRVSDMLNKSGFGSTRGDDEDQQQDQGHRITCAAHGCPMRGTIHDGRSDRGLCGFHYRARAVERDSGDVTVRLRNRLDLVRRVEFLSNAPLDVIAPRKYRAVEQKPSNVPGKTYQWIRADYPDEIPINELECHLDWTDRARETLMAQIVMGAKLNPHSG